MNTIYIYLFLIYDYFINFDQYFDQFDFIKNLIKIFSNHKYILKFEITTIFKTKFLKITYILYYIIYKYFIY